MPMPYLGLTKSCLQQHICSRYDRKYLHYSYLITTGVLCYSALYKSVFLPQIIFLVFRKITPSWHHTVRQHADAGVTYVASQLVLQLTDP
jgi:hypothetical protein